jgi:ABC-type multidrug transport system fused ATPase/permease subunit
LFIDPTVLLTILSLLNIVYIIFAVIQFAYLFGGNTFILPSSFTYAEYARRGFFELIVVTVINFAILFFSITFVKKESRKASTIFTFILLISAFYRMVLYEMAYGYTYLRIFVQAFMILLFVLFIINLVYVWYSKMPIISAYILCSLILFVILNFANVDVIIARNNINRYYSTGEIDVNYLEGLSCDAVAETARLLDCKDEEIVTQVKDYFEREKEILAEQSDWQSYNLSKIKAQKILDEYTK